MRRFAVLFVAALLLAGCPGNQPEDSSQNSPPRNAATTKNTQAVPEKSQVMPPAQEVGGIPTAGPSVQVQLTEYGIQMPETLPPGSHRFQITNSGKENHNFVIEGPGVSTKLANDLTRGDTADVVVDLKAGSYTVYCPVDGHKGKGMQRTLTVR